MSDGLLSLCWNNHLATFSHILSTLREKERYSDATLACNGKFFPVHKLILSVCSDYFGSILDCSPGKHPVVVLRDVEPSDMEALLSYMYEGNVSVAQSDLARLIKTAEMLKIKGLAVPDDDIPSNRRLSSSKSSRRERSSPTAKRKRHLSEDNSSKKSNTEDGDAILEIVMPANVKEEKVEDESILEPAFRDDYENIEDSKAGIGYVSNNYDGDGNLDYNTDENLTDEQSHISDLPSSSNFDPSQPHSYDSWPNPDGDPLAVDYNSINAGSSFTDQTSPMILTDVDNAGSVKKKYCSMCSYSTYYSGNMSRHIRRHTGDKPYFCRYCPYSSSDQSNLSKHQKNHCFRNQKFI